MEYMVIAYALIAIVLAGYGFSLRQRTQAVRRDRQMLESNQDSLRNVNEWEPFNAREAPRITPRMER